MAFLAPWSDISWTYHEQRGKIMRNLAVQQHRSPRPEITEFLAGLPAWANLRAPFGGHLIKVDDIKASYDKRILTVTVPLKEGESPEKHVTIETSE